MKTSKIRQQGHLAGIPDMDKKMAQIVMGGGHMGRRKIEELIDRKIENNIIIHVHPDGRTFTETEGRHTTSVDINRGSFK